METPIQTDSSTIEHLLTGQQRRLVRTLIQSASEREESVILTRSENKSTVEVADYEHRQLTEEAETQYRTTLEFIEQDYEETIASIESTHESKSSHTHTKRAADLRGISDETAERLDKLKKAWQEEVWLTESVYEAGEHEPDRWHDQKKLEIDEQLKKIDGFRTRAVGLLARYKQPEPTSDLLPDSRESESLESDNDSTTDTAKPQAADLFSLLSGTLTQSEVLLNKLERLKTPRLFDGMLLPMSAGILIIGSAVLTAWLMQWKPSWWIALPPFLTAALVTVGIFLLFSKAKSLVASIYLPLMDEIKLAHTTHTKCLAYIALERDHRKTQLVAERNRGLTKATEKYKPRIEKVKAKRKEVTSKLARHYRQLIDDIESEYENDLHRTEEKRRSETDNNQQKYEQDTQRIDETHDRIITQAREQFETKWSTLVERWRGAMTESFGLIDRISTENEHLFPEWSHSSWETWQPPTTFSPTIRFGSMHVDRTEIPHGLPDDEPLRVDGPVQFDLPAVLAFPDECSLFMQAGAEGRDEAIETIQTVMLRLLTSLPPGKIRFTIIDPVGLGQNFAGFMHLADDDEALVTSRIWTDTRHIEQRLADLTEHMEIVIQKYLRNEFETIEQYNVQAGEIAEPYRFLVIADFPVNFNDNAARRLAGIINSGARCGIYTLIFHDTRQSVPRGIQLTDLEQRSVHLKHEDDRFVRVDDDYEPFPLTLEKPPDDAFLTTILRRIGEGATDASRVEVPFDVIAPLPGDRWSIDSTDGIRVPLGRSGATKLQYLDLGKGTAQHALIAGKTGSGKSTLLHVLITNLALWYHPDQVHLYLVDFKKGVEFKTYATHELPHVQAVAIESDREFGLSVLQRLDTEMKQRGRTFREIGVQDMPGYRNARPDEPLPRILLIIDEFQEFFVEDDKLGQEAALLLDRLVRQGRAFGIHIILGSQTLGGAYSLARSTIGQMAVRIALQCAEADSYMILSDDNAAARLLSRPGEAIYNAAGGAVEGNSPFQVTWLPDEKRDTHLGPIPELTKATSHQRSSPLIVFEGHAYGKVQKNKLLANLIQDPHWPDVMPSAPTAWLGEAIAIKDPTHFVLNRHSGSNLMIIGQRDEPSLAITTVTLISLASQIDPSGGKKKKKRDRNTGPPTFSILDSIPEDDPQAGYLKTLADLLPHRTQISAWREIQQRLEEIAEELDRRQANDETNAPPLFLFIHGLHRFRILKKQEDDFGFSSYSDSETEDKPSTPDRLFERLLREGPPFGIHSIIWCDTTTNLNRMIDRNMLREIELRVLFQMSATDSSHLIDSPEAGKLGLRRALYFCEELGRIERFRPYALPDLDWLKTVADHLSRKK